jgi:tetratricopeptide (TPR) repeat protein
VDKATESAARTEAAGDTFSRVEDLVKDLRKLIDNRSAREAAERALNELAPMLDRLEQVMPHQDYRRAGRLRESAAIAANNIGVALTEAPASPRQLARDVFALARRLSTDDETLAAIRRNEQSANVAPVPPLDVGHLWNRVTTLIRQRRYAEAEQALEQILAHSRRPGDQQQARGMIATMRRLQEGGPVALPSQPSTTSRVLLALLHVALGLVFLATLLTSPLVPCLVIGGLGLLCCLGAAGSEKVGRAAMPSLAVIGAVVAGLFWVVHANGVAIAGWLTVCTAVVLLVVVPVSLAGQERG